MRDDQDAESLAYAPEQQEPNMNFPMKLLPMILPLFTLCAATAAAIDKPEPEPVGGKVKWVYDYEEGRRLSRETDKPMFVVFRCER